MGRAIALDLSVLLTEQVAEHRRGFAMNAKLASITSVLGGLAMWALPSPAAVEALALVAALKS